MTVNTEPMDLDVDLQGGVVPISKVASSLAALLKRGRERRQPIIVTQKGYPTGVLLPIDMYVALRELAERGDSVASQSEGNDALAQHDELDDESANDSSEEAQSRRSRGGPRAKKADESEN